MKIENFSVLKDLILSIVQKNMTSNFIEIGTSRGEMSFWAANFFDKVYTFEISDSTVSRKDWPKNIEFIVAHSRTELSKLIERVEGRSFFLLNGYYCSNQKLKIQSSL